MKIVSRFDWKIILLFILAFCLRLILITSAHHGDLNNNISWGAIAYEKGLNSFYEAYEGTDKYIGNWPYSAPNQPPLTIYLFTLSRVIWEPISKFIFYMNWELLIFPSRIVWFWEEKGMDILVKLPSIVADLGIGLLIYKYLLGVRKKALLFSAIWLFNPVIIYNSTIWGQTDPIVNLLGLIGIIALIQKKLVKFAIFITLSILFKPSLSIFVPVLLLIAIAQKHTLKTWIISSAYCLITIALLSLPFHPYSDVYIWLFKLYTERFIPGEIGFLTANSFNFWWLVNPGWVYDNTLYFGLSARVWGFVVTVIGIATVIHWLSKQITDKKVFFSLSFTALLSFLFMTRIHERYLYPFFPSATLLLGLMPGYWLIYSIVSFIHLINLYNFFWVPELPILKNLLLGSAFPKILSLINIAMLPTMAILYNKSKKTSHE